MSGDFEFRDAELRKELFVMAGYLTTGEEQISRTDAQIELSRFVARICADRSQTVTSISMIAVTLARWIERG